MPSMQSGGQAVDIAERLSSRVGNRSGPSHAMDGTGKSEDTPKPLQVKPKKIYTWICGYCGQNFKTEYYSQRYCNNAHKQAAYRERKNIEA
ncbi:MAG TPA: hypothetical protein VJ987_04860 [Anaerolineales bacterium]|nr:hypothetical protein [Anaerolineales bacterium]